MKQPEIQVKLIATTTSLVGLTPEEILIYTKSTRLEQGADTRNSIINEMSPEKKAEELNYIANTIPSSWEFIDYTFEIKNVTRAFTHQFVRTRTGSYAQQTMRMLEKKDFTYRIPPKLLAPEMSAQLTIYTNTMSMIQSSYDAMVATGVAAEDARGVLPTNIHTNIIAKFNLRTLAEMARARSGPRTQDEYREVLDAMIHETVKEHPWSALFLCTQAGRHAKALEEKIIMLRDNGKIDKELATTMLKHIDKMRKKED